MTRPAGGMKAMKEARNNLLPMLEFPEKRETHMQKKKRHVVIDS